MQVTQPPIEMPVRPAIALEETVRSLLREKGSEVFSVTPDTTVYKAISVMAENRVGCLLVLSAGRLAGILSERDYARKGILMGRNSHYTLVREIMNSPVHYVTPQQSLDYAMRLMTLRRVRHLPVLDGDDVIGVVSIGDMVRRMLDSQQRTIRHLEHFINGDYPA